MTPKQFEITCSSSQPLVCPFEGDIATFLSLKSANAGEVVTSYKILLRTISDKELYIKLNAFTFAQRDDPGSLQAHCSESFSTCRLSKSGTDGCVGSFRSAFGESNLCFDSNSEVRVSEDSCRP